MLQKMGFELGDILLALWDPEATYQQDAALNAPANTLTTAKRKRASTAIRDKAVAKAAHNKEPILKFTPARRTTLRGRGKVPKLSSTRRGTKSRVAARLN
jgi:hypothetical protein